jgi:hypothetical protein
LGKPLISDAAMRGMHDTMQRIRTAKRHATAAQVISKSERTAFQAEPESLLAALLSQAHRRDTLLTQGNFPSAEIALDVFFPDRTHGLHVHVCPGSTEECAAVAAGMALKQADSMRSATPRPVVIALLREFPALTGVLQLMQDRELSLILVVQAEPETRADAQRRLLGTKVPIMPVDATDAVAVCRVTQESMLRARSGWGSTVIHALRLPSPADPLQQIESHMRARGILDEIKPLSGQGR